MGIGDGADLMDMLYKHLLSNLCLSGTVELQDDWSYIISVQNIA